MVAEVVGVKIRKEDDRVEVSLRPEEVRKLLSEWGKVPNQSQETLSMKHTTVFKAKYPTIKNLMNELKMYKVMK